MRVFGNWTGLSWRHGGGSAVAALALLVGCGLLAAVCGPPWSRPSGPSDGAPGRRQCSAVPCAQVLASVTCQKHGTARLDLRQAQGGDVQFHWRIDRLGVDVAEPYALPRETLVPAFSSLFDCHAYAGPVDVLVEMRDGLPLRYGEAGVSVESSLAVLADSLRIALPVLVLLALAVLGRPRRAAWFALVFVGVFAGYSRLAPAPKGVNMGDNRFYLPAAATLVRQGNMRLDAYANRDSDGFSLLVPGPSGHRVNYYPAAVSLFVSPLVAWAQQWNPPEERLAEVLAKVVAALSVAIFFLICRNLGFRLAGSLALGFVFAFTTSQFSIHAGGLSSHNLSSCLGLVAIWLLARPALTPGRVAWLAVVSVAGLACRHDFAFLILGCGLTVAWRSRKLCLAYCCWMAVLLVPCLLGARQLYGQWLPPYVLNHGPRLLGLATGRALAGLLLAPNRGVFVYSPLLLLGYVRAVLAIVCPRHRQPLAFGLAVSVLSLTILLSTFPMWWGGWSYGPRLLGTVLGPVMVLTALQLQDFAARPHRKAWAVVVAAMVLWGAFVHGKGALVGDGWNATPQNVDNHPERLWDVQDLQMLRDINLLPQLLKERMPGGFP